MKHWRENLVLPTETIRDTIKKMDIHGTQIALVVDKQDHLLGTVTDGDVRRALLSGISLDNAIKDVMNSHPTVAHKNQSRRSILALMRNKTLFQMPVVDQDGIVVGLEELKKLLGKPRNNWVLLMAGGLGTRLRPLTDSCPKPMLHVGGKPILETILDNFIEQGFRRFYISVNFMAEKIIDHFGDGSEWGVEIVYLRETDRLGTAGALSLIPKPPTEPLLIMNGDLLTQVNFNHLLDFHIKHKSVATMAVREYEFQVPYGVVNLDSPRILRIDEKPTHHFFVNAGIYVLKPEVINLVPKKTHFDMTTLFDQLIEQKRPTAAFPVLESWLDVGRLDDFERAHTEYSQGDRR